MGSNESPLSIGMLIANAHVCYGQMGGKKSISHSHFFALLLGCWYYDTSARRTSPRDRLSTRLMKEAKRKRERKRKRETKKSTS